MTNRYAGGLLALALLLSHPSGPTAETPPAPEELTEADQAHLKALVLALSSEEFDKREAASEELRQQNDPSLRYLRGLLPSITDGETKARVRAAIRSLLAKDLDAALAAPVSCKFSDTTLEDVLSALSKQTVMAWSLDQDADVPDVRLMRIGFEAREMSVRSVMRWMALLSNLHPRVEAGKIVLSREKQPTGETFDRSYDLAGLPFAPLDAVSLFRDRLMPDAEASVAVAAKGRMSAQLDTRGHERLASLLKTFKAGASGREIVFPENGDVERARVLERLNKAKVSFEFVDTPLVDAIAKMHELTGVTLVIDPKVLAAGPSAISLRVSDMGAEESLSWILKLADLDYCARDEGILIGKIEWGRQAPHEIRLQNVQDLANIPGHGLNAAAIADIIRNRVHPESWDPNQGTSIEERAGWLVLVQSHKVQEEVHDLLESYRAFYGMIQKVEIDGTAPEKPLDPLAVPKFQRRKIQEAANMQKLREALQKKVSFRFTGQPLGVVLEDLSKQSGADLVLDPRMEAEGVNRMPVHLAVAERTLEDALKRLKSATQIGFVPMDGVLFLSKQEHLQFKLNYRELYVRDLECILHPDDLARFVHDRWMARAFRSVYFSLDEGNGNLVLTAPDSVCERIEVFLNALRAHSNDAVLNAQRLTESVDERAQRAAVREKLQAKITLDLDSVPLLDALDQFQAKTGLELVFVRAAKDETLPKVTLRAADESAEHVLQRLLEESKRTFALAGSVIEIDEEEKIADLRREQVLYRVDDLISEKGAFTSGEKLVARLTSLVAPNSWVPADGTLICPAGKYLMVDHLPEVHEALAKCLEKLRADRKDK